MPNSVNRRPFLAHGGVEASSPISNIINNPCRAVRFNKTVLASDYITIAFFILVLVITGVRIVDAILERVPGVRILKERKFKEVSIKVSTYVVFDVLVYEFHITPLVNLD